MTVKISLDSAAIEKLMNADPEFIVELKRGVVENFTKKCIRPLLNIEELKEELNKAVKIQASFKLAATDTLRAAIETEIGTISRWCEQPIDVKISPRFQDKIKNEAKEAALIALRQYIDEGCNAVIELYKPQIKTMVETYLKRGISELVDEELQERVKALTSK
jgi:hypothetical protein